MVSWSKTSLWSKGLINLLVPQFPNNKTMCFLCFLFHSIFFVPFKIGPLSPCFLDINTPFPKFAPSPL